MIDVDIEKLALVIMEQNLTIRSAGKLYNIPKSTIHYMVTKKLIEINYSLYLKLHKYLQNNFNEKHIRGGMATKNKYKKLNKRKKQ